MGAHALRGHLQPELFAAFQTGVQYLLWHTLALMGVAGLGRESPQSRLLPWSGALMLAGIVLFSGSLFALSLTGWRWLGMITPLGGLALLSAWFLLAMDRFRRWQGDS